MQQDQSDLSTRASDSDRDEAISVLNDALATGRLNVDEHGERIQAALEAVTLEELNHLTADVQAPPLMRQRSLRRWWIYAVLIVALAAIIALVLATHGTPANTSRGKSARSSVGTHTASATCTGSSGSTQLSCTGPENTRVVTPRFTVSTNAALHYIESSNCASGTMLLYIYQIGVSSVPEPSLFGCNSLTYPLTAGTYYITVIASGDWKLFVTSG
jgi:hypothetical protein